ncbi:TPA: hypothetical protein R8E83_003555 [Escherichia coli]|nr:hypothetical protein [Escherichia coli]
MTTPITKEQLTDERIEKMASETIESIADHLLASNNGCAGTIEVHAGLFLNLLREVQKCRMAGNPELKIANLANKFYERYPLDAFKNDGERAAALGYFMAGAELQCFGEFIKYEDLFCDE